MKVDPQATPDGFPRPEGDTHLSPAALPMLPGLLDCMHCGLCLQSCPTYRISGAETDSPRGRLALLRAAGEGRLSDAEIVPALDRCLACRGCEPVCPSSVPYHSLLEAFQTRTASKKVRRRLNTWLGSRRRLAIAGFAARFARRARLLPIVRAIAPAIIRRLTDAIPVSPSAFRVRPGSRFEAKGVVRGSVSLHLGCVDPQMFGEVLQHTIEVLQHEGFHIEVPTQPSCCGALEAHAGAGDIGRHRGNATLRALRGKLAILVPASGCASFLHELDPKLPVLDPMAFLYQEGLRSELRPIAERISYDPPCHQNNVLKSTGATRALLQQIPQLDLVEADDAELCCGAGGTAFLREPELSMEVGSTKAQTLMATGASKVVSGNSGCRLQLEASLRLEGSAMSVAHPISLLHRALLG